MLISEIIERLEELRSEYFHFSRNFKELENQYSGNDMAFLSDEWRDHINDLTDFRDENNNYYSFLSFTEGDQEEINLATKALQDPEIAKAYQENFELYVTDTRTHEEAVLYVEKGYEVIRKINEIASENRLSDIGFQTEIFLGLDTVHYESSRCW